MWDAACPCACVFACVVCLCVCVLSSWHSSTNLSSIFHSDRKRPDSNSIVPWKVHFHLSTSNKICHVLKGQMPGLGQMWGPVMIFTCQIPDFAPGGGSHVTMIGALVLCPVRESLILSVVTVAKKRWEGHHLSSPVVRLKSIDGHTSIRRVHLYCE